MEDKAFLEAVGQKIRAARKSKGIAIDKMAKLSNVDLSNLSFLERGQRNCHILSLKSIADVLQMEVKEFL